MIVCIRRVHLYLIGGAAALLLLGMIILPRLLPEKTVETILPCRFPEETFVIDPGHGGEDGGAVSISGREEADVNLSIGRKLEYLLGFYGVNTVMTRTEDISIHDSSASTLREKKVSDLKNRVALINATEQATLISIHQNSFPQQKYHGLQVFYRDADSSKALAEQIQALVRTCLDPSNERQVKQIPDTIYLMKNISCRAVLVECGFLSNPNDDQILVDQRYQQKIAATIAAACLQDSRT